MAAKEMAAKEEATADNLKKEERENEALADNHNLDNGKGKNKVKQTMKHSVNDNNQKWQMPRFSFQFCAIGHELGHDSEQCCYTSTPPSAP
eukprot:2255281-Amphidinium_carterae.1